MCLVGAKTFNRNTDYVSPCGALWSQAGVGSPDRTVDVTGSSSIEWLLTAPDCLVPQLLVTLREKCISQAKPSSCRVGTVLKSRSVVSHGPLKQKPSPVRATRREIPWAPSPVSRSLLLSFPVLTVWLYVAFIWVFKWVFLRWSRTTLSTVQLLNSSLDPVGFNSVAVVFCLPSSWSGISLGSPGWPWSHRPAYLGLPRFWIKVTPAGLFGFLELF